MTGKPSFRFTRRGLLTGGAAASLGAAAALVGERSLAGHEAAIRADAHAAALLEAERLRGTETLSFYGEHQAGVETEPQAQQVLVALTIRDAALNPAELRRMLASLTQIAARLTQGRSPSTDASPELGLLPARLTVTFGFGRRLVDVVNPDAAPSWLADLPPFTHDVLREEWNGGDLLLQIAADDPVTMTYAQRQLLKVAREFATVRWTQSGFRRAYGTEPGSTTQRNLMGQLDGTANPVLGSEDFAGVVWNSGPQAPLWLDGGTSLVVRRITMHLDRWDRVDRTGREQAIGRRLDTGAPLTGTAENDEPDLEAKDALGFPTIGAYAHVRRARSTNPRERIYRRSYNYDLGAEVGSEQISDSGLVFTSFQRDVTAQFLPLQSRIDELDLLNEWTTHIGSAVFAIPAGCREGEFVGQALFD